MEEKKAEVSEKCEIEGCAADPVPGFAYCQVHMETQYGDGYRKWHEINDDLA